MREASEEGVALAGTFRTAWGRRGAECVATGRIAALALVMVTLLAASGSAQEDNERCFRCHGEKWIGERSARTLAAMVRVTDPSDPRLRSEEAIPGLYTPREAYDDSAHGGMDCASCHPGIDRLPHAQVVESISCASCHAEAQASIEMGMHSSAFEADGQPRPSCTDCHGDAHSLKSIRRPRGMAAAINLVETCGKCHGTVGAQELSRADSFHDSIHGQALYKSGLTVAPTCTDCHGYHELLHVTDPRSPLYPPNVPDTCGKCHEGVADVYYTSVHGQHLLDGDERAATCTSCHHSHGVEEVGDEFLLHVVQECSNCHIDLGRSYVKSYHGKATQLGYAKAAVCSSCHGAHDILPKEHPDSRVAKDNLVETCATCHPKANEKFVQYLVHVDFTDPNDSPPVFWTFVIMTTLLLSVLALFIPHTLLWFQRTLIGRLKNPAGPHLNSHKHRQVRRFNKVHRLTHALIVISFMGLVLTGFPLKYSYATWAQNLTSAFGGIPAMGLLHRIFAITTFAYVGVHLAFLGHFFLFKCPKPRLKYIFGPNSMMFTWRDLKDFFAMVRWFFWLGPRPKLDRWAYFEKFDYWGEIWGVVIIGGSGLLLWFPTLFTNWLPGWVLNCAMVVHSIEALLAASVIFLVHFFNTHLRPEKFPIDMTMFTGSMSEEEMIEERGREYERLVAEGKLEERVVPQMPLRWRIVGVVLGMSAFLMGIVLIVLAAKTEISQFF